MDNTLVLTKDKAGLLEEVLTFWIEAYNSIQVKHSMMPEAKQLLQQVKAIAQ